MKIESKTEMAIELLRRGNLKAALVIFSRFRMGFTSDECRVLQIAKECLCGNSQLYRQIGIDTDRVIEAGKRLLLEKYDISDS